MVIRMSNAAPNASWIAIVPKRSLVWIRNASIHASASVLQMPIALLPIIRRTAPVWLVTLVIHPLPATKFQDVCVAHYLSSRRHPYSNLTNVVFVSLLSHLHLHIETVPPTPANPCVPSPCGPYSQCRDVNERAICSCLENYVGSPPACRPECTISSECFLDKACVNQKCVDPCRNACGQNARCQVINHNPICSCSVGYVGDPFISCHPEESKTFVRAIVCC